MNPVKKVMIAVGFAESARELVAYGVQIAESMDAELLIVNIIIVRDVEAIGSVAAMGYEIDSEHYVSDLKGGHHVNTSIDQAPDHSTFHYFNVFCRCGRRPFHR